MRHIIGTLFPLVYKGTMERIGMHPPFIRPFRACCGVLALLALPTLLHAQADAGQQRLTRILFVMDCSNSMNAFWGNEPKIDGARKVLLEALGPTGTGPDVEFALRLYGHQTRIEPGKQDCDDTRLEVPFGPHNPGHPQHHERRALLGHHPHCALPGKGRGRLP
jgi:hypothetical protein